MDVGAAAAVLEARATTARIAYNTVTDPCREGCAIHGLDHTFERGRTVGAAVLESHSHNSKDIITWQIRVTKFLVLGSEYSVRGIFSMQGRERGGC